MRDYFKSLIILILIFPIMSITTVWLWVKENSVLKYLLFYLVSLLIFAYIYSCFSEDFYHTSIKYESHYLGSVRDIEEGIKKQIISNYLLEYNDTIFEEDNLLFLVNRTKVYGFSMSNTYDFTVEFQMLNKLNKNTIGLPIDISLVPYTYSTNNIQLEDNSKTKIKHSSRFDFKEIGLPYKLNLKNIKQNLRIKRIHNSDNITFGLINKYPLHTKSLLNTNSNLTSKDTYFIITEDLAHSMDSQKLASKGFPYRIKGNFMRMLYFSASTITGLGLGDILPLTDRARLLITIQNILGVIIMGLFINEIITKSKIR